jgi:hypothetical protein
MSRTSPSGPGAITDKFNTATPIQPGSNPPGIYFIPPSLLGSLIAGQLVAAADLDENFPPILGVETRPGKIGKCRVALIAPADTAGSADIILQWNVNGIPVGDTVTTPWTTSPIPVTYETACAAIRGELVEFPGAVWESGDVVILQVTLGALLGSDSFLATALEKNYP